MKNFGNSDLGHLIGVALVLAALLIGLSLIVNSCSNAAASCAKAGGSYNGNDGSCTVGGHR